MDIVALLIEHGADVNAKDELELTPLHYAAEGGIQSSQNIITCLLLLMQSTFWSWSIRNSVSKSVLELLIKNGANVNAKNVLKYTPLHLAAKKGNIQFIKPKQYFHFDVLIYYTYVSIQAIRILFEFSLKMEPMSTLKTIINGRHCIGNVTSFVEPISIL